MQVYLDDSVNIQASDTATRTVNPWKQAKGNRKKKKLIKAEFLFLSLKWVNCDNVTDRPAVHDGRVVFSVLLLAEFNEGRFLLACTAASAVWGIGRFTWGLNGRLHLPQLPFLLWCLKITHERAHQTKRLLSSSILIQSAGWPLAKLFEHSWPLPPQVR